MNMMGIMQVMKYQTSVVVFATTLILATVGFVYAQEGDIHGGGLGEGISHMVKSILGDVGTVETANTAQSASLMVETDAAIAAPGADIVDQSMMRTVALEAETVALEPDASAENPIVEFFERIGMLVLSLLFGE